MFLLERRTGILKTGEVRNETVVGLCRRDPAKLSASALLEAVRAHWTIENKVHWVRDVDWREEPSRVRTGTAPRILASFRNAVLSGLDLQRKRGIARHLREFAWNRDAAIAVGTGSQYAVNRVGWGHGEYET